MKINKKGFTLVELIVSFTVLAILLGSVIALLPSFYNQYNHVQNTARTQSIGTTLLELLESQLGYATSNINILTTINDDYDIVEFDDKDGNEVKLSVVTDSYKDYLLDEKIGEGYDLNESNNKLADNLFIFHYTETKVTDGTDKTLRDAVNWGYNSDFYMNNIVKEFHVEPAGSEYRKNVLRISFVLMNSRNGMEIKFTRLIECSNFQNSSNNGITVDGKYNDADEDITDNDKNDAGNQNGTGTVTLTDSKGSKHIFRATLDWEEEKNKIENNLGNTVQGGILGDGDDLYLIYRWSNYIHSDELNLSIKELAAKYPQMFLKLEPTNKIWIAEDRIKVYSDNIWPEKPKIGDLCYLDGVYYVAASEYIGQYSMPPDQWIRLYKNGGD